jgi:hypothetical protein
MKLSGSDVAVSAAVLLGACGLLYLFAVDINATAARTGEKALGTVVFKKLSATRKAPTGLGWERMRNNSPVYEADTLRTAGFSEAAIYFDEGTSLDMLEDSMLKLDFRGPVRNLEFLGGEISVGSSRESSLYTISSSAGAIKVDKDSKATFSRRADSLSVEVDQGQASIVRQDGSSQAISKNQELEVNLKSGTTRIVHRPILPLKPERNARLLSLSEAQSRLDFAWEREGAAPAATKIAVSPNAEEYHLEVAGSKDFEAPVLSLHTSATSARAAIGRGTALADGTWYWRVRDAEGKASPVRRFSVTSADPPRPALPAEGQEYAYREAKPEIRFAWTAMDAASGYLFELSAEPKFEKPAIRARTATASLSVDSLDAGTWYWRVKPVHAFELVSDLAEAPIRSLVIRRREAMAAPSATSPLADALYQIQELDGRGLAFSWIPEQEAVSYELLLSASSDLSSPMAKLGSKEPYLRLSGAACRAIRKPGQYFWGVRWIDREGNASPASPARSVRGVDGSIALHLSFPPEGYRIADSLVANARFAWKSNVPARTVFMLARDAAFKDLAYQETVVAETLIGHAWKSGRYYWRLRTYNADGSVFLETEPRSFEVVDPFEGPPLLEPSPGSAFYLREHDRRELSWKGIGKVDYYAFKLYSSADGYAKALFERSFLQSTRLVLDLGELPSGTYKASVQGFAVAGEGTTRIIGYIGESFFSYKRLAFIKLGEPGNRSAVPGLAMRRSGSKFVYTIEDRPDTAELLVSTDSRGDNIVVRKADRSGAITIKGLAPGNYYWTVKGELAGFDISAKNTYGFQVEAVPPLPRAELLSPSRDFTFGPSELRARRSIVLSWKPVEGATHYSLFVSASERETPVIKVEKLIATSYSIDDLSVLDKGEYRWSVEALAYDGADELEQAGLDSRSTFSIQLPAVKGARTNSDDRYYGR